MSSGTAKEYEDFARDCVRLANQADSPELREKLLNLAREWMHAVMDVEDAASAKEGQWSKAPKQRSSGGSDCVDEHRAELEAMHSPEGRQSLQSVIDSYERMIALIQRRAEKP